MFGHECQARGSEKKSSQRVAQCGTSLIWVLQEFSWNTSGVVVHQWAIVGGLFIERIVGQQTLYIARVSMPYRVDLSLNSRGVCVFWKGRGVTPVMSPQATFLCLYFKEDWCIDRTGKIIIFLQIKDFRLFKVPSTIISIVIITRSLLVK